MIRFTCACGRQLQARPENAGRVVRCPDCGREQVVPAVGEDAVQPDTGREGVQPWRRSGEPAAAEEGPPAAAAGTSGKAITSLVLGLLSFVLLCLTGIPAIILGILALRDISRSRGRLGGQGLAIAGLITGGLGMLCTLTAAPFALLVPAVQKVREAAARVQSQNNLKQLAIAMHSYHDSYGHLPAAAEHDKAGKPLLSWRVTLLPFLGENNHYRQFRLDEPWDGPNNKRLLSPMPAVYRHPQDKDMSSDRTVYQVFVGPSAPFTKTRGLRMTDITDGTANTILIAEAAQGVPWTKPDDLDFDPNRPLPALGGQFAGGYNAAAVDGAVHWVPKDTPELTLRALINPRDGILVHFPER
jgi:hypothetical protein